MKVSIKNNAQGGFTLIELIVVIVILGILAATALPKFASLGGDARLASLNAAKGALNATAAMAHGKWLANPSTGSTLTMEDVTVTLLSNGYPDAVKTTAQAAGLNAGDYAVYTSTDKGTNVPIPASGSINIVPASIAGTASALNCFVTYTASATAPPTVALGANANAANCN
jgi:MSHA pilin protein MshA